LGSYPYVYHTIQDNVSGTYNYTGLGRLLLNEGQYDTTTSLTQEYVSTATTAHARDSQYGVVVFDHEAFASQGFTDADAQAVKPTLLPSSYTTAGQVAAGAPSEAAEETWLDNNSTPLIIGRYDGSLIRGE
jgi:hypothetical protein